jgi:predicted chitinase
MVSSRFLGSSLALVLAGTVLSLALAACGAPASDTSDGAGGSTPGVGSSGAGSWSGVSGASGAAGSPQGEAGSFLNGAGASAGGALGSAGASSNNGGAAGASSAMCTGVSAWTAGTTASEVSHNGKRYLCKAGVAGWCSSPAAAYEPGVGYAWQDAWSDEGSCGSGGTGGSPGGGGSTGSAGGAGSAGASSAGCALDSVLGENNFNAWFPKRNNFYTYANLCKAIAKYPAFATTGDDTAKKREVAGFFANVARETGMLMYIDQINKDPSNGNYWGRGPLQLTWNYNYDACGKAIGQPLLDTPTLVSTDGAITWQTGLWFWMTNDGGTGKTPHTAIVNGNFGGTINAINGGLECKGDNEGADERIAHYKAFTQTLGVDPGTMLTCW